MSQLLLAGVRLLVSLLVWWSGFRAVSDDDYARIVIAQKFASAPALDASGTSWLPFPFWLQGSAMALFGTELETAIGVAWFSGVVSTLLVWLAARTLGLARGPALIAAILATAIPYSAWLGVATVPELLTAGLATYGLATLAVPRPLAALAVPQPMATLALPQATARQSAMRQRCWGALALCCATLSRYETWPVAAVFTLFCVRDVIQVRGQGPRRCRWCEVGMLATAAVVASAGMLAWLVHGIVRHGDAFFFVERVAHYQKALGGHDFDAVAALLRHPGFLVEHGPALIGATTLGALVVWFRRRASADSATAEWLGVWGRPLLACASLVVFLMLGDLRGAGATHHPARTLLPVWFLACIAVAALTALTGAVDRLRYAAPALVVASIVVIDGWQNGVLDGARQFVDRSDELAIAAQARQLVNGATAATDRGATDNAATDNAATDNDRVFIAAEDYGYFAMIAAIADPARVEVYDDHDPRHARQENLFDNPQALQQRLSGFGAVVVPRAALRDEAPLERALKLDGFRSVPTKSARYLLWAR